VLPGPRGWRQSAPGVYRHHCDTSRRSTGPLVAKNTSDPGCSRAGSAPGYCAGSSGRSATVVYPVPVTNRLNSATVTG